MNKMLRIAFWGMGISALGTLPLGTINVAALQISVAEGWYHASLFSLGAALVEVAYVRLSVVGIEWIRRRARLLKYFNWLAFFIVLALAISSLAAANTPGGQGKNVVLNANVNSFVLGLFLSAINPMQIPFWFGWSTVLFGKGVLQPNKTQYNWYCAGIGLGTLIGLAVFVIGGQVLVQNLNANERIVNYTIAGIFFVTALVFLYKIVVQKKTGLPPTPTEPTA
jgi:threonine/homoserine/homoserine lactone efflux protein